MFVANMVIQSRDYLGPSFGSTDLLVPQKIEKLVPFSRAASILDIGGEYLV